ncbi:Y' element ATP-dependent helicase YJL225C-like [Cyprinus carpio]|uniref:Y' element ATP-dependent helicase YJL225C-like n=1 Tax=Cyprinus carpio TaxID=7962 RepID=A0A9Q9XR63_CYPCA|nr:Y' element ATP-dependent helicase YJL225C-like [Cyprinus carpio]
MGLIKLTLLVFLYHQLLWQDNLLNGHRNLVGASNSVPLGNDGSGSNATTTQDDGSGSNATTTQDDGSGSNATTTQDDGSGSNATTTQDDGSVQISIPIAKLQQ